MVTYDRSDFLSADPAEISDHLVDAGLTEVQTHRLPDQLQVECKQGDAAIQNALVGWQPTTSGYDPEQGGLWEAVPPPLKGHAQHLRDYFQAVRDGTQPTKTQARRLLELEEATADLIAAVRLLVRSI